MEPFGWPRGTVRALLTILLAAGIIPVAIWGSEAGLAALAPLTAIAVRDYFAHRADENARSGPVLPEPHASDES